MILLIVIFCLLLLMTAGILMILSAGTEASLAANYRSSTQAFYAAASGAEEGRGRLWTGHPNFLGGIPGFLPIAPGDVRYIINDPAANPTDLSPGNPYGDFEYQREFSIPVTATNVLTTTSVPPTAGLGAPLYQWVRLNPATEASLNIDVDGDGNKTSPVYLADDGVHLTVTNTGGQVLAVTALAVLPDKSQKIVQYIVAATQTQLAIPGATTMPGSVTQFQAPSYAPFHIAGIQNQGSTTCSGPSSTTAIPAITVNDNGSRNVVQSGIPNAFNNNYPGSTGQHPSISISNPAPPFDSIANLEGSNGLVPSIKEVADYSQSGNQTSLPDYGEPSRPVINVVDGDLNLSNVSGYGLLLVTGYLTIDSDVNWHGLILVIGQGDVIITGNGSGGEIDGAIVIAHTRNSSGTLLASLGTPTFVAPNAKSKGIYYDSCLVNQSLQKLSGYKALSFRQIDQLRP